MNQDNNATADQLKHLLGLTKSTLLLHYLATETLKAHPFEKMLPVPARPTPEQIAQSCSVGQSGYFDLHESYDDLATAGDEDISIRLTPKGHKVKVLLNVGDTALCDGLARLVWEYHEQEDRIYLHVIEYYQVSHLGPGNVMTMRFPAGGRGWGIVQNNEDNTGEEVLVPWHLFIALHSDAMNEVLSEESRCYIAGAVGLLDSIWGSRDN